MDSAESGLNIMQLSSSTDFHTNSDSWFILDTFTSHSPRQWCLYLPIYSISLNLRFVFFKFLNKNIHCGEVLIKCCQIYMAMTTYVVGKSESQRDSDIWIKLFHRNQEVRGVSPAGGKYCCYHLLKKSPEFCLSWCWGRERITEFRSCMTQTSISWSEMDHMSSPAL